MKRQRPSEVSLLLQTIDAAPRAEVNATNILDDPVRIYMAIKILYQRYKRNHILQAMQETVFGVNKPTIKPKRHTNTPVTVARLFDSNHFCQHDITRFMEMKEYIGHEKRQQFQQQILLKIDSLSLEQACNCYRMLLSKEYQNGNMEAYHVIQRKMIQKIATTDLKSSCFNMIARHICSLPIISQPILILISQLYEKVTQLTSFTQLFIIFQKNFPVEPTKTDLQALLRICNHQTLDAFKSLVEPNNELSYNSLQIAQTLAKQKLQSLPNELTDKSQHTLNMIIQVAKYGCLIWDRILEWQVKASESSKQYLKDNVTDFLIESTQDTERFAIIVSITRKICDMSQTSSLIGPLVTAQLFNSKSRQLLGQKHIRHLIAQIVLKEENWELAKQLFQEDLLFIDSVLEIFTFEGPIIFKFYHFVIKNDDNFQLIKSFTKCLIQQMPVKFKQIYLKWIFLSQPDLLSTDICNSILEIMNQHLYFEVAQSLIRDVTLFPPTKYLLTLFALFFNIFKDPIQTAILKRLISIALNKILVTIRKKDLIHIFKVSLPTFITDFLPTEKQKIFEFVPQETLVELKRVHDEYLQRKNRKK